MIVSAALGCRQWIIVSLSAPLTQNTTRLLRMALRQPNVLMTSGGEDVSRTCFLWASGLCRKKHGVANKRPTIVIFGRGGFASSFAVGNSREKKQIDVGGKRKKESHFAKGPFPAGHPCSLPETVLFMKLHTLWTSQ